MSTPVKHHSPGFLVLAEAARARVHQINVDQYQRLLAANQAGQLVDVREDNEWEANHVRGAMHLSRGVIERDIETTFPDKDTKLVLYCGGGFRSALAAESLQKMGYTNILSLDGGWRALETSGVPLER